MGVETSRHAVMTAMRQEPNSTASTDQSVSSSDHSGFLFLRRVGRSSSHESPYPTISRFIYFVSRGYFGSLTPEKPSRPSRDRYSRRSFTTPSNTPNSTQPLQSLRPSTR